MADLVAQLSVWLFLVVYSALLTALIWWALRRRPGSNITKRSSVAAARLQAVPGLQPGQPPAGGSSLDVAGIEEGT